MPRSTTEQLLGLLKNLARSAALESETDEWKAVRIFLQGLDTEQWNAQGIAPIRDVLDEIRAIDDLSALHTFFVDAALKGVPGLFGLEVFPDLDDSSSNALYLSGGSLGLPKRDYYLEKSDYYEVVRTAYIRTHAAMLQFAGHEAATSEQAAQAVFAFEQQLAMDMLSEEESRRDFDLTYNPTPVAELASTYPLMDWQAWFDALGLGSTDQVIVMQRRYMRALADIVRQIPLMS